MGQRCRLSSCPFPSREELREGRRTNHATGPGRAVHSRIAVARAGSLAAATDKKHGRYKGPGPAAAAQPVTSATHSSASSNRPRLNQPARCRRCSSPAKLADFALLHAACMATRLSMVLSDAGTRAGSGPPSSASYLMPQRRPCRGGLRGCIAYESSGLRDQHCLTVTQGDGAQTGVDGWRTRSRNDRSGWLTASSSEPLIPSCSLNWRRRSSSTLCQSSSRSVPDEAVSRHRHHQDDLPHRVSLRRGPGGSAAGAQPPAR